MLKLAFFFSSTCEGQYSIVLWRGYLKTSSKLAFPSKFNKSMLSLLIYMNRNLREQGHSFVLLILFRIQHVMCASFPLVGTQPGPSLSLTQTSAINSLPPTCVFFINDLGYGYSKLLVSSPDITCPTNLYVTPTPPNVFHPWLPGSVRSVLADSFHTLPPLTQYLHASEWHYWLWLRAEVRQHIAGVVLLCFLLTA